MKITFCLVSPKGSKESPISAFIHHDGSQMKLSTGVRVSPRHWSQKRRRTKSTCPSGELIDRRLLQMEGIVSDLDKRIASGERIDREQIREALNPKRKEVASRLVVDAYNVFLDASVTRLQPGTIGGHRVTLHHLERFEKSYGISLTLDGLDTIHLDKFAAYLRDVLGMTNNTLSRQATSLRAMLNWHVEKGVYVNPAYKKFRVKTHRTRPIALSLHELKAIQNLALPAGSKLEQVRDAFVVQAMTGVRISDLSRIRPESIQGDRLHLVAQKTGDILSIRLLPDAQALLAKYGGRLPVPALTNYNSRLKVLGRMAGIISPVQTVSFRGVQRIETVLPKCELFSSHLARRTFITIGRQGGMTAEEIMSQTGHKDFSMMARYSIVTPEDSGRALEAAWGESKEPAAV